jgi:hypothetical protein
MSAPDVLVHTMRVGVFSDMHSADRAVARLLLAGFATKQITVVCSGETQEDFFRRFDPTQKENKSAGEVTSGATIGAAVAGLSAIAIGAVTGAVPLVVAGVAGAAGGGALGGFLGIMTSKGVENDFLNACHEQVLAGKILVSAEDESERADVQLAKASRIFVEEGSEMNSLPQP